MNFLKGSAFLNKRDAELSLWGEAEEFYLMNLKEVTASLNVRP